MNTPSVKLPTSVALSPGNAAQHYKRLVVAVPSGDLDESKLALQVGRLALADQCNILFLSIDGEPENRFWQQRRLATLTALVNNKHVHPAKELTVEPDWVKVIKQHWEEGDLVVCLDTHYVNGFLHRKQSLEQAIDTRLHIPVQPLSGIPFIPTETRKITLKTLLAWGLSLGVIGLFAVLQFQIQQEMSGWASTVTLYLSVIMEMFLIWKVNQYIGR